MYTLISIYNTANVANQVTVSYYDMSATLLAQCVESINAGEGWLSSTGSALSGEICVGTTDSTGYVTISAEHPIAVWGVVFSFDNGGVTPALAMSLTFYAP